MSFLFFLLVLWLGICVEVDVDNNTEVKFDVYGKRQTASGKNKTFAVCLQLSVQLYLQ